MKIKLNGIEAGGNTGKLIITDYSPGSSELRTNYTDRPNGDGVMVGADYLGKSTWGFDISTNTKNLKEAMEAVASFGSAWQKSSTRMASNVPVPMSYTLDGVTWYRVYGRCGAYTGASPDVLASLGVGKITADFVQTRIEHFADDEQKETLTFVPATTGGLRTPLVAPLTTRKSSGERAGFVTNAGDLPTPMKITFHGPIKDPLIRSATGWSTGYLGTIAGDQRVVIDPLLGTVKLYTGSNSGVNVAGRLTVKTRLSAITLPVGKSEFFFSGNSETGLAKAELAWRDAYGSMRY